MVRAALMMLGASALVAMASLLAKALGQGAVLFAEPSVIAAPLHPLQISAGRLFFALIAVSVVAVWMRPDAAKIPWGTHVARSVSGWAGITCLFAAAARMPLADATAISFLSPLVTMVLAILFLGERVGPVRWVAAGIAVIGALLLIRPGTEAFQPAALIALGAAGFMGFEAILIKRLSGIEPPLRILLINNLIGVGIAAVPAWFVWTTPTGGQWAMLVTLGLIMIVAQALFLQAMTRADASYVIPFFYATLVFAAFYDLVVFSVWPQTLSVLGALTIAGGVLLLAWREGRARRRSG